MVLITHVPVELVPMLIRIICVIVIIFIRLVIIINEVMVCWD